MVKIFKGVPYTGTLPATLTGTKAGYLHKYKIYGNLEQTGTPTPENPIVPSECGERTENLFDLNRLSSDTWTTDTRYYMNGGIVTSKTVNPAVVTISVNNDTLSVTTNGGNGAGFLIKVKPSTEYRLAFTKSESLASDKTSCTYALVNTSETIGQMQAIYGDTDSVVFTTAANTKYVYFVFRKASGTISYSNIILSEGQTSLPYEPYGYKLPLLSGSTPVDIYLGESQTTRRIKKLVLTGEETWYSSSRLIGSMYAYNSQFPGIKGAQAVYCSHLPYTSVSLYQYGTITTTDTDVDLWMFTETRSPATFKTYLAQQYANGTPVTIWYVLAFEETGTLNEPLRKIGNYADTIDSTQTSAQIPTTAGSTTISWAGSGLAPSEFDSIAEWVSATPKIYTNGAWMDAQTYVYDDGTWVADN